MKGIRILSGIGLVMVLLAVAACGQQAEPTPANAALTPNPTATPTSPAVATPAVLPTATPAPTMMPAATATPTALVATAAPPPASTPVPTVAPTATTEPTAAPTPAAAGPVLEGLFLKITSLPKESVVRARTVPISGITSPDALVSVNGMLLDVDSEGGFTTSVSLNDGTNLVEVLASDFKGNDVSSMLTIIYIP